MNIGEGMFELDDDVDVEDDDSWLQASLVEPLEVSTLLALGGILFPVCGLGSFFQLGILSGVFLVARGNFLLLWIALSLFNLWPLLSLLFFW